MSEGKTPNRLASETSPYLLQHAHNPVDWYPWGEEALAKARQLDRPIFLSVGYSACHWCHVMERESFEDPRIAALMNEHFVNIKVDREERPDIDSIYMTVVQMLTGSGGWPMSVFLTPDLRPFYGGTYFPPAGRHGRPGFPDVLTRLARYYRENREKVEEAAAGLTESLRRSEEHRASPDLPAAASIDAAVRHSERSFDAEYGGFGPAPKFPRSVDLSLLFRWHDVNRVDSVLQQCEKTLECMALGGMYDQIGGGFHRYSVDRKWLVPHFEKMLYDNALLARTYLEALQVTGKDLYRRVATEVLDYSLREMASPEGGFYSATDADSEGEEGRFFVWTPAQVREALGDGSGRQAAALVCAYYDITDTGNFERGTSIPNAARPLEEVAADLGIDSAAASEIVRTARAKLYEARSRRVPPLRDEKIITSWNGLMTAALARGYQVLGDERYLEAATGAVAFIFEHLHAAGRLRRTWKDGRARYDAYLDDYAYLAEALLDLYEATFELEYLRKARGLIDVVLDHFRDAATGGFFYTADDHEELICRKRDVADNATPAASGVVSLTLLRLERLTEDARYREAAEQALRSVKELVDRAPMAFGYTLLALDFLLQPTTEIAVIGGGEPSSAGVREGMLRAIHGRFLPRKVLAGTRDAVAAADLVAAVPWLAGRIAPKTGPVAFVCRDSTCGPPSHNVEQLASRLSDAAS